VLLICSRAKAKCASPTKRAIQSGWLWLHDAAAPRGRIGGLQAVSGQEIAQREIVSSLETALDARRHRILVSRAEVNMVKWSCLLLQAVCALVAIAFVHCDDPLAGLVSLALFATGVAASILLIAAHDRPFTGQISISPQPLLQILPDSPSSG
jgi:membrane protein YdbS with pleckstrin-like domain